MRLSPRWSSLAVLLSVLAACGGVAPTEPRGAESAPSAATPASANTGVLREVRLAPGEGERAGLFPDNPCHNTTSRPRLTTYALTFPPQVSASTDPVNSRLTRKGIEYMASAGLHYQIASDGCTVIQAVRVGNQAVSPSGPRGYGYSVQSTGDATHTNIDLGVSFPRTIDGETEQVTITVGHALGLFGTTISFPIVHAENVQAAYAAAPVTVSRAEMWNLFSKALYNHFGGTANSTYTTHADGSQGYRIYNYDPSSLQLGMDGNGVSFQFHFKASIPGCDPDVRAYGTFKLVANAGSPLATTWPVPPNASLSYPFYCSLGDFVPLLGELSDYFYRFVQSSASDSITGSVQSAINDALPTSSNTLYFNGTNHLYDEVQVKLQLPVPSVGIAVPYDAFALGRVGTLLPVGDPVRLTASGLGMSDYLAGSHSPASDYSGPNGVPLTGTTSWANPETLTRTATNLVWSAHTVGNLLASSVSTGPLAGPTVFSYRDGCVLSQGGGLLGSDVNRSVVFGVNDTAADAARVRSYGSYGYHLRMHFVGDLETPGASSSCHSIFVTLPIVPVQPPASLR